MDWGKFFTNNLDKLVPAIGVIAIIYYVSRHDVLNLLHKARDEKVKAYTLAIIGITLINLYVSTLASGHDVDPLAKLGFHATILIGGFVISHAMFEQWREVVQAIRTFKTSNSKSSSFFLVIKELVEAIITSLIGFFVDYFNFFIVAKDNGTLKESNKFLFSLINPLKWRYLETTVEDVPTIMIFLVGITAFTFLFIFLLALAAWDEKLRYDIAPVAKEPIRMPNNQEVIGFFFKGLYICKSKSKVLFTYNMNKNLLKDFLEEDTANKILGIKCYKGAQKYYDLANPKEIYSEDDLDPDVLSANMQLYYDEMEKFSNEIQRFWDRKIAEGFEANTLYPVQDQHRKGGYHTAKP